MKDLSLNNTTGKPRAENCGIRLAEAEDLPALRRIYAAARAFMAKHGNAAQWGANFPPDELLLSHISRRELYVFEEISIGNLHAAFALVRGEDPAYRKIDGSWLSSLPYLTIHRVASDGTARGVFSAIVKFAEKICPHLRADTHEKNAAMRAALIKNGFSKRGEIRLSDGSPRLAYEKL